MSTGAVVEGRPQLRCDDIGRFDSKRYPEMFAAAMGDAEIPGPVVMPKAAPGWLNPDAFNLAIGEFLARH
jgi:hypothetical protein